MEAGWEIHDVKQARLLQTFGATGDTLTDPQIGTTMSRLRIEHFLILVGGFASQHSRGLCQSVNSVTPNASLDLKTLYAIRRRGGCGCPTGSVYEARTLH